MRTPRLPLCLLGLALCLPACGSAVRRPDPSIPGLVSDKMGSPRIGERAPDFSLPDPAGRPVRLSSLRGSVVVLHFGASWCPFCAAELPHLEELARRYRGRVEVVLVDVREEDREYQEYLHRGPVDFHFLRDRTGDTAARYAPPGALPTLRNRRQVPIASNLVIDREGRIAFFTLVDTANFDERLVNAQHLVDEVLGRP